MNQCVPSWELDHDKYSSLPKLNIQTANNCYNSLPAHVPSLDYEVAELTWENGQLAMHGLCPPRQLVNSNSFPSPSKYGGAWDKPPPAGGTLESLVDQAMHLQSYPKSGDDNADDLVPWFDCHLAAAAGGRGIIMDALVPCDSKINNSNENRENSTHVLGGFGTCVGSCSGATAASLDGRIATVGIGSCKTNNGSVSESATCGGGRHSRQAATTFGTTYDREFGGGGFKSAENTISAAGKDYTKTSGDDHDSVCHSRSQRNTANEEGRKKGSGKSSVSTKRRRAAAIHNQSERKRRDRINERMRTLQKLVPNSSKTDKASMLGEVIGYLKQLQTHVQLMNKMVPLTMQQQQQQQLHQMSMMVPMGIGMGMGMGVMQDINMNMNVMNHRMLSPLVLPFMPLQQAPSWDNHPGNCQLPAMPDPLLAFLACQSQPMSLEAYSRLAALYQQFQQPLRSNSGSSSDSKN